jgi:7-keto-8-aminopelargonate synthetase-like enzyme
MQHSNSQIAFFNDVISKGREQGLMRMQAFHNESRGSTFNVNGKQLSNFLSNNYLGFEMDERVKQAAIEGIQRFGLQTSISRHYLSFDHYNELEEKLEKIFGLPTIISSCTSLGNMAYIPMIVDSNDAIIIDQFAHSTIKMAVNLAKVDGCYVETIKHNQMEVLEKRIKTLRETHKNIWYMADSVYSMHGDTAPFQELEVLLNTYENFNCYIDDAHGMSWIGENGKGHVLHSMNKHERLYVIAALNKGFGAMSAALIFPNKEVKNYVENANIAITTSAPTPHAGIFAASKIADIHLSSEIYEKQAQLNEMILFFKKKAKALNLPIANFSHTPLFFLAAGGKSENLYLLSKHFIDAGFLISAATSPIVPISHSGFRISLSLYQTVKDVDKLLNTIAECIEYLEKKGLYNREEALKGFKLNTKERERTLALI